MLWYIAFIAALNLGAGYYWGAYLRRCPRCALVRDAQCFVDSAAPQRQAVGTISSLRSAAAPSEAVDGAQIAADFDAAGGIERMTPSGQASIDSKTELATREFAEQRLAELAATGNDGAPVTAALVEVNRISPDGKTRQPAVDERVFRGVSEIVRQSLDEQQIAASFADQQLLLLVPNEDVHQATRRAEELRQRVASTEFVADGEPFQTTVTCALAEVSCDATGPRLFEYLEEALGEAKRYGGNRTFMHDGNSPAPVVPSELTIAPQQLAI
jgi:GGDEF domain-containing protein